MTSKVAADLWEMGERREIGMARWGDGGEIINNTTRVSSQRSSHIQWLPPSLGVPVLDSHAKTWN